MKFLAIMSALLFCFAAMAAAQANPVPSLNQPLTPAIVRPGSGAFTLTLNGTGFVAGSVVQWNGSARATTFVSGSQLTAAILASDVAAATTATVRVVNPGAQTPSNAVYLPVTLELPATAFANAGLPITGSANDVALGDLNNDGIPDLAACQEVSGTVSLYKGAANAQFTFLSSYEVRGNSAGCGRVIMADLNGDGKLDVVVSNGLSLVVFLGNGDGTLQAKTNWITGGAPVDVVAADFNRDGKLDLATANFRNGTVSVLLGNGDGTFQQPRRDYGSIPSAQGVVAGDFNGDGILDLASTSSTNGQAMILLGKGDGTFQPPSGYAAGTNAGPLVAADLNGDGVLDLFVIDDGHGSTVLLGNGDGSFQTLAAGGGAGSSGNFPLLQDVNGDGYLDAVFGNSTSISGFQLLYGNGDGTFQAPIPFTGPGKAGVAAADFNGDGMIDFAFAAFSTITVVEQTTDNVIPGSIDFGSVTIGTSLQAGALLSNFGTTDISIQAFTVMGVNKADFAVTSDCGAVLPPRGSCILTITFTPTLRRGELATVAIKTSAPGPLFLKVSGSGM